MFSTPQGTLEDEIAQLREVQRSEAGLSLPLSRVTAVSGKLHYLRNRFHLKGRDSKVTLYAVKDSIFPESVTF